jgi:putative hydrolase of the HAD superfamily
MANSGSWQAVIFDRDGVLTDFDLPRAAQFFTPRVPLSLWEIFARWEAYGQIVGFPNSMEAEQEFFADFWSHICTDLGLDDSVRRELQQFDYTTCLTVYPDVRPALTAARDAGLPIGVLSNFALASLEHSLQTTGLADWVDAACAATVIGAAKPAPRAYAIAAARLGVQPEACLFFDDELPCVEGARAVGMRAFHVDRGRSHHALDEGVVADLSALAVLLAAL